MALLARYVLIKFSILERLIHQKGEIKMKKLMAMVLVMAGISMLAINVQAHGDKESCQKSCEKGGCEKGGCEAKDGCDCGGKGCDKKGKECKGKCEGGCEAKEGCDCGGEGCDKGKKGKGKGKKSGKGCSGCK